jgi:Uma2 family endonuclease
MTSAESFEMQSLKTKSKISFSPLLHRYTLEEFWELPELLDSSHYDLIGGLLFMVPPPTPPHDDLDARLNKWLMRFLLDNNIDGDVHHPQAAIYLEEEWGTYLYPDMMYVSHELRERMGKRRTSADIVFEYSSPSTSTYDRTTKADTYLALGVNELWLIDPTTKTIEVRYARPIENGLPQSEGWIFSIGDVVKSRVLSGWEVSVEHLFAAMD